MTDLERRKILAMQDVEMNRDEYSLLTAAREDPVSLQFLADTDRGLGLNLPDPPDLFGEKLVDTLLRIFERGRHRCPRNALVS